LYRYQCISSCLDMHILAALAARIVAEENRHFDSRLAANYTLLYPGEPTQDETIIRLPIPLEERGKVQPGYR